MKIIRWAVGVLGLLTVLSIIPSYLHAENMTCNPAGYTVVHINGVFTNQRLAEAQTQDLSLVFESEDVPLTLIRTTDFQTAYNPTHLAGFGDLLKSVMQKMWEVEGKTKEDFDLQTIVKELYPKVKTQKILIIGHSQGTFYANALYDYLINRGISARSVAVLNIATPASYVAGHGQWITSDDDQLVNEVRNLARATSHPEPLPWNISIPAQVDDVGTWAGHSLSGVYLKERPTDIAAAMARALVHLQSDTTRDKNRPCFPVPDTTLSYLGKTLAFGVLDPAARVGGGAMTLAQDIGNRVASPVFTAGAYVWDLFGSSNTAQIKNLQFAGAAAALGDTSDVTTTDADEEVGTFPTANDVVVSEISPVVVNEPLVVESGPVLTPEPVADTQPDTILVAPSDPAPTPVPPPVLGFGGLRSLDVGAGAGGGGGGGGASAAPTPDPAPAPTPDPIVISVTIDTPALDAVRATTTIVVAGTSDASLSIEVTVGGTTATTTAGGSGDWSVTLNLSEGAHTIEVVATDGDGNTGTASREVTVDLTAPTVPTVEIGACGNSLSSTLCLVPFTDITVSWDEDADVVSYAVYVQDAFIGDVTGTSTVVTLSDKATSSVLVVAQDLAGNAATSTALEVAVDTQPVIINEIAWGGTTADEEDEWIELRNTSSYLIDMTKLRLVSDGGLDVELAGNLRAANPLNFNDLYLIERSADTTNAAGTRTTLFDLLDDAGEALQLVYVYGDVTTVLDQTPAVSTCSGWCAGTPREVYRFSDVFGTVLGSKSMERVDGEWDGAVSSSWQTNDGYTDGGATDSNGGMILGTPKYDSGTQFPVAGWSCGGDLTFDSGAHYTPSSTSCVYYSQFINPLAKRYGAVFRGTVGSSTKETSHSIGFGQKKNESDTLDPAVDGELFFTAIWETRNGPSYDDVNDFFNWFKYGTTTSGNTEPPHDNYRVIEWVYGP